MALEAHGELIAYDCAHQMANVSKINMLEPAECSSDSENSTMIKQRIILVQSADYIPVHIYQCKVEITRMIMSCGSFSDSGVAGGLLQYVLDISQSDCEAMHHHKTVKLYNEHVINDLILNGTKTVSLTLAGGISSEGTCSKGSYTDVAGTWSGVYVVASVKITLRDSVQQVSTSSNKIVMPSGQRCVITDKNCVDFMDGFTFWAEIQTNCEMNYYTILYEGEAEKSTISAQGLQSVMFTSNSKTPFSLLIDSNTEVCGHKALQTEHPRLKIIISEGIQFKFQQPTNTYNLDLFTYMNSKLVYLERHLRNQIIGMHKSIIKNQCESNQEILRTQLSLAYSSPNDFAYIRLKKPGYTALPAGEVMYLVKCQAVPVKKAHISKCYNELPVVYKNATWFMSPRTHLLQRNGNEVSCNGMVPPSFLINGKWFSFSPTASETSEPEDLNPDVKNSWNYENPSKLINSGIYSEEQIEELRYQLMFPSEKEAAVTTFTNKISQPSEQGFSFNKIIDESEISSMVDSYFAKATGVFSFLGSSFSVMIGIWVVSKCVKFLADSIIHGYALYKKYGFDYRMSAMIWDAMSTHLLSKQTKCNKSETVDYSPTPQKTESLLEIEPNAPELYPQIPHKKLTMSDFKKTTFTELCIEKITEVKIIIGGVVVGNLGPLKGHYLISEQDCTCISPLNVLRIHDRPSQ